jgi:hypothetical protein
LHWRAKVKLWKVAISLAAVGAVAAPGIFGIWGFMPKKEVWVPLTEEERQQGENLLKSNACVFEKVSCDDHDPFYNRLWTGNPLRCYRSRGCTAYKLLDLEKGRRKVEQRDLFKYWVINLEVAFAVFVGIFGLVMVLPAFALWYWIFALWYWRWLRTIALRYWGWLKT